MSNKLLIIGAGGHGKVVKEIAVAMEKFDRVDFLDDHFESAIGKCEDIQQYTDDYSYGFVAFGNNEERINWILKLRGAGFQLPVLIHPTAYTSPSARVEMGSIVCAKAVVNTNSIIEKGCIIGIGALVDHDSFVSEGTHINSGAIVKAGCKVERLTKVEAGIVYSNVEKKLEGYSFEVGV